MVKKKYLYVEYAVVNFGTDLGQEIQQLDNKQWIQKNQGFGLDYIFCGFWQSKD